MPRTPFAPDPHKWIDTAHVKPRRAQKPLIGFRHNLATPGGFGGLATPPSSAIRRTIDKDVNRTRGDDTPLSGKQGPINGHLTPPTTTSEVRRRGVERLRWQQGDGLGTSRAGSGVGRGSHVCGKGKMGGVGGSGLEKAMDDYWGSDDTAHDEESHHHRLVAGPLRRLDTGVDSEKLYTGRVEPRNATSRSPSIEIIEVDLQEHDVPHKANGPQHDPQAPVIHDETPIAGPSQLIRSSHLPHHTPSPPHRPSESESSPPPRVTPIPDHILAIHRQLCGRETARMRKIRSPWREPGDTPPSHQPPSSPSAKVSKTKMVLDKVGEVDMRAKELGKRKRGKENEGVEKEKLVVLSDEEEEKGEERMMARKVANGPLTSRKSNVMMETKERRHGEDAVDKNISLDERAIRIECYPSITKPDKPDVQIRSRINEEEAQQQPEEGAGLPFGPETASSDPPTSTLVTPRKQRHHHHVAHHKITPLKVRTPSKVEQPKHYENYDHTETLFAFPHPRQPDFKGGKRDELGAVGGGKKGWRPIQMEAETLITWSLGSESRRTGGDAKDEMGEKAVANRPDPTPLQGSLHEYQHEDEKRKRTDSDVSTESLAPSIPSQSFPKLVQSSPKRTGSTRIPIADPPSDPTREDPQLPSSPQSSSHHGQTGMATPRRSAQERWSNLQNGILSVPIPAPNTKSTDKDRTAKRKKTTTKSQVERGSQQSRLVAFGFFPDQRRESKAENGPFEGRLEDETDLEFGQPEQARENAIDEHDDKADDGDGKMGGLGCIPQAPYHPDLRPAGIAELKRRERQDESIHRGIAGSKAENGSEAEAQPPLSTPSVSSDSNSSLSAAYPNVGQSAEEWLLGLGERRSSEFGSFHE